MITNIKVCKKGLQNLTLQTQKYKVIPFRVQAEIKDAVEKSMITISEALLARALLSKNAAADVRAQLTRLANQKVGQVHVHSKTTTVASKRSRTITVWWLTSNLKQMPLAMKCQINNEINQIFPNTNVSLYLWSVIFRSPWEKRRMTRNLELRNLPSNSKTSEFIFVSRLLTFFKMDILRRNLTWLPVDLLSSGVYDLPLVFQSLPTFSSMPNVGIGVFRLPQEGVFVMVKTLILTSRTFVW